MASVCLRLHLVSLFRLNDHCENVHVSSRHDVHTRIHLSGTLFMLGFIYFQAPEFFYQLLKSDLQLKTVEDMAKFTYALEEI